MANKVVTFLEDIGHDFKVGLGKLDPFIKEAIVVATKEEDVVSNLDPALGAIFKLTVATVSSIEQKFAAMAQQTGSGVQKLAEATTILEPVIAQAFSAAGKASERRHDREIYQRRGGFPERDPGERHRRARRPRSSACGLNGGHVANFGFQRGLHGRDRAILLRADSRHRKSRRGRLAHQRLSGA